MPIGEDDIQAHVDGRLSPDRQRLLEDYFSHNPAERARADAMRADLDALRQNLAAKAQEPVPPRLRVASIQAGMGQRRHQRLRRAAAAVALLAIGAAGGWFVKPAPTAPANGPAQVAFAASDAYRTFVVEVMHPVEVGVDQEAHLIKWLSNRTGTQLTPPDLSGFGYALVGGRILPGGGETAAQLMYETEAGARLTVYLRPGATGQTGFTFQRGDDLSSFVWVDDGFDFAVTADLDRTKLLPIATSIYETLSYAEPAKRAL